MNEMFRYRKSLRFEAAASLMFFLALTACDVTLFFLKDPETQGFKNKHSMAALAWFGIALFGTMGLLSGYVLAASYLECLSIVDNAIVARSVFQQRRLLLSEIEALRWVAPGDGKVVLTSQNRRAKIHLANLRREDRLRVIRRLRKLIPEQRQEGWPLFCLLVALPLRDGISPLERIALANSNASTCQFVLITRRRYDMQLAILLPLTLAAAFAGWWAWSLPRLFGLPILVVLFWLFLRYQIPPEGKRQLRVTGSSIGRLILFICAWPLASLVFVSLLRYEGVSSNAAQWTCLGLISPVLPIFCYGAYRIEKQQKRDRLRAAASAVEFWQHGEE